MKKVQLRGLRTEKFKLLNINDTSRVFLMPDGRIFKMFNMGILELLKLVSVDIEQKILDSSNRELNPAIVRPEESVYDRNKFVGYIMQAAKGINYNDFEKTLTLYDKADLYRYANFHSKLEEIIKSTSDIVYPDICSCDNIYVSGNDIQLIDYDGFQVGNHRTAYLSSSLGNQDQYVQSKKYFDGHLFTKELDKKSLILLYFLDAFNVDLNKVGMFNPHEGRTVTLDDVFQTINLKDYDLMNKVWKVFQNDITNEYLGEDVFRIAEDYEMKVFPLYNGLSLKKLVRK